MLLIKTIQTLLLVSVFASLAHADAGQLQAGTYKRVDGPEHLCSGFTIKESDLKKDRIYLGGSYQFLTRTQDGGRSRSEFDSNCEFALENRRSDETGKTTLEQIESEICAGKPDKFDSFKATIEAKKITLVVSNQRGHRYSCVWTR